ILSLRFSLLLHTAHPTPASTLFPYTTLFRSGWWDYVLTIPAPRVIAVHDLDDPRGQGAQWGEVQANIHRALGCVGVLTDGSVRRSEEHTSELQSRFDLVCRLLLEKKKKNTKT